MTKPERMVPDADDLNNGAVSVYGQDDAMDDFPVLKAFQQYIDAEQARARKRLVSLGIFFSILMGAIIGIFVMILLRVSDRNQALNDRLVEFAMKERERQQQQAPVVVQPPAQQDNSAIMTLTAKIEGMQKELMASQQKALEQQKAFEAELARQAKLKATPPAPSQEQLEIERLKALLKAEQDRTAAEKAKQREAELEAYRREHYPELYGLKKAKPEIRKRPVIRDPDDVPLGKKGAIRYFDDDEDLEDDEIEADEPKPAKRSPKVIPVKKEVQEKAKEEPPSPPKPYVIPVDLKGSSSTWRLP